MNQTTLFNGGYYDSVVEHQPNDDAGVRVMYPNIPSSSASSSSKCLNYSTSVVSTCSLSRAKQNPTMSQHKPLLSNTDSYSSSTFSPYSLLLSTMTPTTTDNHSNGIGSSSTVVPNGGVVSATPKYTTSVMVNGNGNPAHRRQRQRKPSNESELDNVFLDNSSDMIELNDSLHRTVLSTSNTATSDHQPSQRDSTTITMNKLFHQSQRESTLSSPQLSECLIRSSQSSPTSTLTVSGVAGVVSHSPSASTDNHNKSAKFSAKPVKSRPSNKICSRVLIFLLLVILIGIAFVLGFIAAQYFQHLSAPDCDHSSLSSASSSFLPASLSSSSTSPVRKSNLPSFASLPSAPSLTSTTNNNSSRIKHNSTTDDQHIVNSNRTARLFPTSNVTTTVTSLQTSTIDAELNRTVPSFSEMHSNSPPPPSSSSSTSQHSSQASSLNMTKNLVLKSLIFPSIDPMLSNSSDTLDSIRNDSVSNLTSLPTSTAQPPTTIVASTLKPFLLEEITETNLLRNVGGNLTENFTDEIIENSTTKDFELEKSFDKNLNKTLNRNRTGTEETPSKRVEVNNEASSQDHTSTNGGSNDQTNLNDNSVNKKNRENKKSFNTNPTTTTTEGTTITELDLVDSVYHSLMNETFKVVSTDNDVEFEDILPTTLSTSSVAMETLTTTANTLTMEDSSDSFEDVQTTTMQSNIEPSDKLNTNSQPTFDNRTEENIVTTTEDSVEMNSSDVHDETENPLVETTTTAMDNNLIEMNDTAAIVSIRNNASIDEPHQSDNETNGNRTGKAMEIEGNSTNDLPNATATNTNITNLISPSNVSLNANDTALSSKTDISLSTELESDGLRPQGNETTQQVPENSTGGVRTNKELFGDNEDSVLVDHDLINLNTTGSTQLKGFSNGTTPSLPNNGTVTIDANPLNATNGKLSIIDYTSVSSVLDHEETFCLETQFRCPNSKEQCLDHDQMCDGIVDCPRDRFDEMECVDKKCGQNFMCGVMAHEMTSVVRSSIGTISNASLGSLNGNGSSLMSSSSTVSSVLLSTLGVNNSKTRHADAKCIPRHNYCDGIWDCQDGSDEIDCLITKCGPNEIKCRDSSACLTGKQACDGVYNCRDHSDEIGCVSRSSCESAGRFYCDSGLCIEKSLVCDGRVDCHNGTDERNCYTSETCSTAAGKYFCKSGECIDAGKRCDGYVDCLDYSDEDRCYENDLDGVVYVYNSNTFQWSLLCVEENFTQTDADELCSKMGHERALNYTMIEVSRLLANSTWALVNPPSSVAAAVLAAAASTSDKQVVSVNGVLVVASPNTSNHNISSNSQSGHSLPSSGGTSNNGANNVPIPTATLLNTHRSIWHSVSCPSNLTVSIVCKEFSCHRESNSLQNNTHIGGLETPEETPNPLYVVVDNQSNNQKQLLQKPVLTTAQSGATVEKCPAYTIASKWLITSGECLNNLKYNHANNLSVKNGNHSVSYGVKQVRIHPQYSIYRTIRFADHDMALVETDQVIDHQVTASSSISLPANKLDPEITCFIGAHGNGDTAFRVLESSVCNSTKHFAGSLTTRQLCASHTLSSTDSDSVCLPPHLPLLCLTSQSQWYLSGFISYQRGCDPNNGRPIFLGYLSHPTIFSNLFEMKSFIEQSLGYGTYNRSRPRISDINFNDDQSTVVGNARALYVRREDDDRRWQKSLNFSTVALEANNGTENGTDLSLDPNSNSTVSDLGHSPITNVTTLEVDSNSTAVANDNGTVLSNAMFEEELFEKLNNTVTTNTSTTIEDEDIVTSTDNVSSIDTNSTSNSMDLTTSGPIEEEIFTTESVNMDQNTEYTTTENSVLTPDLVENSSINEDDNVNVLTTTTTQTAPVSDDGSIIATDQSIVPETVSVDDTETETTGDFLLLDTTLTTTTTVASTIDEQLEHNKSNSVSYTLTTTTTTRPTMDQYSFNSMTSDDDAVNLDAKNANQTNNGLETISEKVRI